MIKLLVLVVVVLAIITIAQIVRIAELVSELNSTPNEDHVKPKDNKQNGILMMLFLIGELFFIVYQIAKYKKYLLPVSASEHGVETDWLLNVNFLVIGIVFVFTQILLFYYAYKYSFKKENKAIFYPDNHKLELLWTAIPTVVLLVIITLGLAKWNAITTPPPADALKVELYAKQFDWTARYAGKDQALGKVYYKNITDNNIVGLDTTDKAGFDDVVTREVHLPKGKVVDMIFHSRDVIHSAYFPHFRAQMNCVPGMTTMFNFKPTITTAEMRKITNNEKFDYVLLCNKVCGVAHYNMKIKVVVETQEEFNKWLSTQKEFKAKVAPVDPAAPVAKTDSTKIASIN